MASPFSGLDTTTPSRNYEYLRAGRYLLRVKEFRQGTNRGGVGYARFAFTVCAILDPSAAAIEPKGPHTLGETISWVLMANKDASKPNLKAALMAVCECPAEDITDAAFAMMTSDAQPLAGLFIEIDSRIEKMAKKEGNFLRIQVKRRVRGSEVKRLVPPEVLASLQLDVKDED